MRSLYAPLLIGLLAAPALAQNPRPSQVIDTASWGGYPSVASAGDLTAVAYKEDDSTLVDDLYVTTSSDNGLTWTTPVRIDSDTTGANKYLQPWSAKVSGDNIYVAWVDERFGTSNDEVMFTYSTDRGVTWSADQVIDKGYPTGTGAVVFDGFRFEMTPASPVDNLYFLISSEGTTTNDDLYLTASSPTTLGTFLPAVYIPDWAIGTFDADQIGIGADGDTVYVAWGDNRNSSDDEVWFQKSTDRGQTWLAADVQVDDASVVSDQAEGLHVAALGNTVLVSWMEERPTGDDNQMARVSTDGGTTWSPEVLVAATESDRCWGAIAANGNLILAWVDDSPGSNSVFSSLSTDGGTTWSAPALISTASAGNYPRTYAAGDTVAIVWSDGGTPDDVATVYSLDGGATWTPITVNDTTGDADFTELAINADFENIVVVWESDDTGTDRVYAGGYSVCGPATVTHRTFGINVDSYVATTAVLGGTFTGTVDLALTGHNLALLVGYSSALTLTLGNGQTLLVNILDPAGELLSLPAAGGTPAVFTSGVPIDPAFCGIEAKTQAVHFGGAPLALTNAQDLVLGAF